MKTIFLLLTLFLNSLMASERRPVDNFIHSAAFLTLSSEMKELDNDINELLSPYIEIIECQYRNKEHLSKKHSGLMLCILEQSLSYLLDSKHLNHSIIFKYYGKNKKDIRIGYLNIDPEIRISNKWWPLAIYRDIKKQIFNISFRLKLVKPVKIDVPDQFAKLIYDELIVNFQNTHLETKKHNYSVEFYHRGIFQHMGWVDIFYDSEELHIDYTNDLAIWKDLL